jgi:hypothetical protein
MLHIHPMSFAIFQDYKNTTKLTWLAVTDSAPLLPTIAVHFDNIISKAILTKSDDFKDHVNKNTKVSLLFVRGTCDVLVFVALYHLLLKSYRPKSKCLVIRNWRM